MKICLKRSAPKRLRNTLSVLASGKASSKPRCRKQRQATSLRARPVEDKARICAAVVRDVWPLVASGAIRPVVDRVLAMSDAAEGHRVVAGSEHVGKVLLAT